MKRSHLYTAWAGLFALCAVLGFLPEPGGALRVLLTLLSLAFFIPPFLLLRTGHKPTIRLLRWLSIGSLSLTVLMLILNFLSIAGSQALGNLLHSLLVIISTPMICSGYWVLSLFLWACILFGTLVKEKR